MNRRTFVAQGCACGALMLGGTSCHVAATVETAAKPGETSTPAEHLTLPVNAQQVMTVLGDIGRSGDVTLIDAVFTRWGYQCFHSGGVKAFVQQQRADFRGYVDSVNRGVSRYWEKLEYDEAGGIIRVTGRKFGRCVCAYAQCPQPPQALCIHCCRTFQAEFFKAMTGCDAAVQIDEAILLGGQRCRTTIRLQDGPPAG